MTKAAEVLRDMDRVEGELRARREWLLKVFALRFGPVPERVRQAVTEAGNLELLDRWLASAGFRKPLARPPARVRASAKNVQ